MQGNEAEIVVCENGTVEVARNYASVIEREQLLDAYELFACRTDIEILGPYLVFMEQCLG